MMHWVPSTKTITITYMTAQELGTGPALSNVSRDGILELARRGKSTIKRAAIVSGSRCADGWPGSTAINEANLLVAVSPGNSASLAASCQGSTSSRASAERTLSSIPFLSSPIGANRKSSNSDPRSETEAEPVISTTEFRRLYRERRPCSLLPLQRIRNPYHPCHPSPRHGRPPERILSSAAPPPSPRW
jgi:hypothetical protein